MKILGICGTHKRQDQESSSEWLLKEALKAAEKKGAETKSIRLINYRITHCLACNKCRIGEKCPLLEDPEDDVKKIFDMIDEADALIFSSPTYAYQQPAVTLSLFHRVIPLHEIERSKEWGLDIRAYKCNPFHGKPVGNMAVGAGLGMEGALYYLFHVLKALGATSVICTGISLLEAETKNLFAAAPMDPAIKKLLEMPGTKLEENECAIELARTVGKRVVDVYHSEVFQSLKDVLKY